jgi:hypothetical protein
MKKRRNIDMQERREQKEEGINGGREVAVRVIGNHVCDVI